ncbi:CHAT domain-containing protein [Streptomyces sp. NPDC047860]|uniref:CHAT domain-containing protein n=1 Tax=Streptomyces sp. NPDC047860 TaxID=3155743 RepID=UPI00340DD309
MPTRNYDLYSLMWELKQAGADGVHDARSFARLVSLICDRVGCATAGVAFDRMYQDWRELPEGTLQSGIIAGQVLQLIPFLQYERPCASPEVREELLLAALSYGPDEPQLHAGLLAIVGGSALGGRIKAAPGRLETALARLEKAAAMMPPGSPQRDGAEAFRAALLLQLAVLSGGEGDFGQGSEALEGLRNSSGVDTEARLVLSGLIAVVRCRRADQSQDESALADSARELEGVLSQLRPDNKDRGPLEDFLVTARNNLALLRARRTGQMPEPSLSGPTLPSADEARRRASILPENARADHLGMAGTSRLGQAMLNRDPVAGAEALGLVEECLDLLDCDDERWLRYASVLGTGYCTLADLGDPAEARHHRNQGIAWLKRAFRLARGPEHPRWAAMGMVLAWAYRMRGDRSAPDAHVARRNHDEARRVGSEAVRGIVWNVLLQSGTTHAAEAARLAGEYALDVARWCIADGAYDDAVRALDAGRGLVLHAATVATTVPDLLVGLGHPVLAREWRTAGPVPPEDGQGMTVPTDATPSGPSTRLRGRVLGILAASPLRQRLLQPPTLSEISAQLRAMSRTALVYLVPSGEGADGAALLVLSDGTVRVVRMPGLDVRDPAITDYQALAQSSGRDAGGPPTEGARTPERDEQAALERLCDWAGKTVMEPLLKELPRGYGSVPSVVLVPMAELGRVPWHAARVSVGQGRYRYACQDVEISSAPSARLLCEVAARAAVEPGHTLVVGDPTRNLSDAAREAEAIHHAFHPDGEFLARGTATVAAVTEWLGRQQGGMLHLACHGLVQQGERHSSYISLADGQLPAEVLTEGRARYRGLELVVLAACSTNVSGRGHDEAYSLATAFLVAGARSVLGSLWTVPDDMTSLLMYMTHHYMSREGMRPGQALRSAQLWMLNDQRRPVPGMPQDLASKVPGISGDNLTGWAGFTHLGW